MKQMETTDVTIGDYDFRIKPFSAFKSARLTGDLINLLAPLAGILPSFFGSGSSDGDEEGIFDVELDASVITQALSQFDGDRIEDLLKTFLIKDKNIFVKGDGYKNEILDEDIANEIFCTDIQDMFLLTFEVIKVNYKGFFKKAGNLSGKAEEVAGAVMRKML